MRHFALISVHDKTSLEEFGRFIRDDWKLEILSTGGTAKFLSAAGLSVVSVSDYTGYPEILEGRVKSLHPKVHGAILARRGLQADLDDLRRIESDVIDLVVVNLYPFTAEVERLRCLGQEPPDSLVELIDIGGPTLIRAAAKNCRDVVVVCEATDYRTVMEEFRRHRQISLELRRQLAAKVFATMAAYDGAIARYFSLDERVHPAAGAFAPRESIMLERRDKLRYGENPHQDAALYVRQGETVRLWSQLQGKELSYNNLVDTEAAIQLFLDLQTGFPRASAAVIVKHTNPCGAAVRERPLEAFEAARACDPLSAFGGIVALSGTVDEAEARTILEGFVEVVVAASYSPEALAVFQQKKNVRVLRCDFRALRTQSVFLIRPFLNEFLLQTPDAVVADLRTARCVSGELRPDIEDDLRFAWIVCKHVKSNAIVVVRNRQAIGVGAGQMSRVDSARLAVTRARAHDFDLTGSVAASDAFLPFADTLEVLNDAGVTALVQPGGSLRDDEVIRVAQTRKVMMVMTGERHFRH